MWSNVALSTTSFSNSSCGLRGVSSHLAWPFVFNYRGISGWSPLKVSQAGMGAEESWSRVSGLSGVMPDADAFGAWSLPLGEARLQLSLTQHLTSSQGSFSEDPREGSKTSYDWVLDIMWQYFHYVLFAVKPRSCRSIHPFLEASPRGLRAVTYRRSGSSLCRLAALKSSSHARIGEEVFQ